MRGDNLNRVFVKGDEDRLRQLMIILTDNAIKYTPEGGKVAVGIVEKERVGITVTDTGIGISKEDLGKIFERFYRVDKARSREMGGNGLGLSIAKELVRMNGGEIGVESEEGEGTRFTVWLTRA